MSLMNEITLLQKRVSKLEQQMNICIAFGFVSTVLLCAIISIKAYL